MKLAIVNGVIVESEEGTYTVPDDIATPLRLERFDIVDGNIVEIPELKGLSNEEMDDVIIAQVQSEDFDELKINVMKRIWSLITMKTIIVKKMARGKRHISDEDFLALLEADKKRLQAAKDGKDVFQMQAMLSGKTQAEERADIIAKAQAWEEQLLALEDQMEGVRRVLENMVDRATTMSDLEIVDEKINRLNAFTSLPSPQEMAAVLM